MAGSACEPPHCAKGCGNSHWLGSYARRTALPGHKLKHLLLRRLPRALFTGLSFQSWCCRQSSVFKGVCLASGAPVILKRYSKAKMDGKADHKMRREVGSAEGSQAAGCAGGASAAGDCLGTVAAAQVCPPSRAVWQTSRRRGSPAVAMTRSASHVSTCLPLPLR